MSAHSIYAPSSAFRWVVCNGSPQMELMYPDDEEGEAAAEGTAAHFYGSEMLLGRTATLAPNGLIITDEMREGAEYWIEDCLAVAGDRRDHLQVEQRVAMPRIHPECFGTPDTWFYDQANGVVYVWDFKFGHGVVEVFENWQLIAYVCGILDLLGIDGRTDQHLTVDMRVVQPRAWHRQGRVRSWRVKASDLRGYFNRLHHAAHGTGLQTGSHCLHCRARAECPTLRRATLGALDFLGEAVPEQLPADAVGRELTLLNLLESMVKARLSGLESSVEARLRKGEAIEGWALENTYGRQKWSQSAEDVFLMGDLLGVDLRKPPEPITPTQARKKGVDASVISAYSETPRTGAKLVPAENLLSRARAAFGE